MHLRGGCIESGHFLYHFPEKVDIFCTPIFLKKSPFLAFFLKNFFQSSKQKNFRGDFLKKSRFIAFFFNKFPEILLKFLLRRRRRRKKIFLGASRQKVDIFCTFGAFAPLTLSPISGHFMYHYPPPPLLVHPPQMHP